MYKPFIYFFILFVTLSCNVGAPKKPKDLISKKRMVNILIDAKLLGSATYINKSILQEHGIILDKYVYEKHGIDSLQFATSNAYYAYYTKEYESIYEKVIDSLEALKKAFKAQELKETKEEEKRKKDSIEQLTRVKDSLKQLKTSDSLKLIIKKDSITKKLKSKNVKKDEGVLITPVSDNKPQSRK